MSKFLSDLELPITNSQSNPQSGFVRIVGRPDGVYKRDSNGNEKRMVEEGETPVAVVGDSYVFIQDEQPTSEGKYIWIQTNVNGNPLDFQVWFEDGAV